VKKVLIITYYWPPGGGAGVQRWLKFVKYLREFGWEPIVYTAENPEAPATDTSLLKDIPANLTVIKTKIWEPYSLYKSFTGQKQGEKVNAGFISEDKKPGLLQKISVWIRGNFFIPDARKFWIKPSIKFLTAYLKENPVDVMVSTGPPHSMHRIALGVKKNLGIPWLADFRDPWTNIDFYDQLMLTSWADAKHRRMEKEVLTVADWVLTVSWNWADEFKKIVNRNIFVLTNGFDEDDFSQTAPAIPYPLSSNTVIDKFSICHIGAMNADRNPVHFWEALKECIAEQKDFAADCKIHLIGKTDIRVKESIQENGLSAFVTYTGYLPHATVTAAMQASQVLLLPLNDTPNTLGVIPGKLFEYMASRRPIFAIGKEQGDSAKIIRETNAGVICDFKDKEKMKEEIMKLYILYRNGEFKNITTEIASYSRREQAKVLSGQLNRLASKI